MNDHTRKILDDAINDKFDDVLNDLDYDDIDINASDEEGKTVLHYASKQSWDSILLKILEKFDANINVGITMVRLHCTMLVITNLVELSNYY